MDSSKDIPQDKFVSWKWS